MKILVPIKRVVDPYAKVRPLADGSGIDLTGQNFAINPFDEIAVEEAARIKERDPSTQVTAISIGGPEVEDQLRKALAMGADESILVESTAEWDSPSVADELAAYLKDNPTDVVIMGKQATDDDNNQVGQMLAAKLGWPQATFASKIELKPGEAVVTRETDTGEETLSLPLPAVITVDLRLNEPRYIALPGIIKARSKPLNKVAPKTSPRLRTCMTGVESPPSRQAGKRVGSVDELLAELKGRGVLNG
ncbi:MAG: electron transfer flavoprotein subunit beta/FixA family protein [Armatimonadetes bacterium]|nr:electron transfer flavoprotein subunit beta/FixA family protein [Armatimonadota bacterium]